MSKQLTILTYIAKRLELRLKKYSTAPFFAEITNPVNNRLGLFFEKTTPFNTQSDSIIFRDKIMTQKYFGQDEFFPKTKHYVDPNVGLDAKYLTHKSIKDIKLDIVSNFEFPVILKRNSGERGKNVFLVHEKEVLSHLMIIFDKKSPHYDTVALAQQYLPTSTEYRCFVVSGQVELIYEKKLASTVAGTTKLKKSCKEDVCAKNIAFSDQIAQDIIKFLKPLLKNGHSISWAGFDVLRDEVGKYWLLEINSSPGLDFYLKYNNANSVEKLYEKALTKFFF